MNGFSGRSGETKNKTPFFSSITKAFHSVSFYDEVRTVWAGRGFLFLLGVIALASVLQTAAVKRSYVSFVGSDLPEILSGMPEITIRDGQADFEGEQPFFLRYGDQQVGILDTTGTVVSLERTDALMLLTRSTFQMRGFGASVTEIDLADLGELTVSAERIRQGADQLATLLPVFVYPLVVATGYLYRLLQLFAFALLARIWTLRNATALSFDAIFRLTAVALTPAIFLEALSFFLDIGLSAAGFFSQVVAAAYVFLTLRMAIRKSPPSVAPAA